MYTGKSHVQAGHRRPNSNKNVWGKCDECVVC